MCLRLAIASGLLFSTVAAAKVDYIYDFAGPPGEEFTFSVSDLIPPNIVGPISLDSFQGSAILAEVTDSQYAFFNVTLSNQNNLDFVNYQFSWLLSATGSYPIGTITSRNISPDAIIEHDGVLTIAAAIVPGPMGAPETASVSEPASLTLFGASLLGLAARDAGG
jgi:hypothetical protein